MSTELHTIQINNDEIWLHLITKKKIYLIRRRDEVHLDSNQEQGTLYKALWRDKTEQVLIRKIFDVRLFSVPVEMYQSNPDNLSEPIKSIKQSIIGTPTPQILENYAKNSAFGTVERWLYELSKEISNVPQSPQTETFDLFEIRDFKQNILSIGRV